MFSNAVIAQTSALKSSLKAVFKKYICKSKILKEALKRTGSHSSYKEMGNHMGHTVLNLKHFTVKDSVIF